MSNGPQNPPANWYPDPTGSHQLRYWDGNSWTGYVSDAGVQSTDSLDGSSPSVSSLVDTMLAEYRERMAIAAAYDAEVERTHGNAWNTPIMEQTRARSEKLSAIGSAGRARAQLESMNPETTIPAILAALLARSEELIGWDDRQKSVLEEVFGGLMATLDPKKGAAAQAEFKKVLWSNLEEGPAEE